METIFDDVLKDNIDGDSVRIEHRRTGYLYRIWKTESGFGASLSEGDVTVYSQTLDGVIDGMSRHIDECEAQYQLAVDEGRVTTFGFSLPNDIVEKLTAGFK